eukprot:TRINITY_DN21937_c0_g1_i1.p1 TRINITY_DN21937_c0_g1~~TRINITY_DN21937_c0_g1_i1.p1  ORF type:complete len:962 (+),score=212.36 TRINITY_DN21937_c0_g1_i1:49-2934(+)
MPTAGYDDLGVEAPFSGVPPPPGLDIAGSGEQASQASDRLDQGGEGSASAPSRVPAGAGTRNRIFDKYLEEDAVATGIASGDLIRGTLRVSTSRRGIAFVKPDGAKSDEKDFVVRGKHHRNRAVHGDVVVIKRILQEREASSSSEEEDLRGVPTANSDSDSEEELLITKPILGGSGSTAPKGNARARGKESSQPDMKMAKVVAIADAKGQSRAIVCTLHPHDSGDKQDVAEGKVRKDARFVMAKPTDQRMPTILLQVNDVTRKILKLPGRLDKFQLWPVQVTVWDESSANPLGRLKGQCLGQAGSLVAEERHALIENELDDHDVDFAEEELDEVDQIVLDAQANFEAEVKKNRHDLRKKRIFTIDPATAKDLDDAIDVKDLPQLNQIEVGVHIADVAHFLKLGTITDKEAQRRSTSVYLIGRVLPMLPHGLCNHLCSLNPNEPKLAFSAFFRLNKQTGELVKNPKPWFQKTAISSVCRLNYEEAQDVIDGKEFEADKVPQVYSGYTWKQIKDDILLLYDVCGKVRTGRLTGGALTISKMKMVFHTRESEDGLPTGYHLEQHSASHWVIEELMLLANRCVAEHLANSILAEVSVLRNHKAPDQKKAKAMEKLMQENLSIKEWDMNGATAIYRSCQNIYKRYGHMLGLCVEMMTMRAGMKQAEYFVYGTDPDAEGDDEEEQSPHHFALNFDYYTHFTSPIRRYPDVMVHRVLESILKGITVAREEPSGDEESEEDAEDSRGDAEDSKKEPKTPAHFQTRDQAMEQVKICNEKKTNSRKCQEQLDRAVFCIYLRSRNEWFYTIGTVLQFNPSHKGGPDLITVYCSQLGRESKARLCKAGEEELDGGLELFIGSVADQLMLPAEWNWKGRGCVDLTWLSPDNEDDKEVQTLRTLSCVPIVIIPTNTAPIDYSLFFVSPFHRKFREVASQISELEQRGFDWTGGDEEDVDVQYSAEDGQNPLPSID